MLKRVATKLFGASNNCSMPQRIERPKVRLQFERFEDRINPAGWLDDYANWFNRQVGDGYSDAVGGAIHSGLSGIGFSDADLAAKDDMQLVMGTTVIAVPLGIGLFAGGEVVLGVGTIGGGATAAAGGATGATGGAAAVQAELRAATELLNFWVRTAEFVAPGSGIGLVASERIVALRAQVEGLQTMLNNMP